MLSSLSEGICGANTQEKTNALIDHLHSLSPGDPIEARLQGQFLALQSHGMRAFSRAQNAEMFYHVQECFNIGAKLLKLANDTIDALTRNKTKGQQQVFVTHVNDGGKAIVGNLNQPVGDGNKS
ncbi:MAG TPA: hypothetical protein VLE96_02545 [Chlamydiales bacterium]|nr:hypothetical protein [Chlamydiales bacterium]